MLSPITRIRFDDFTELILAFAVVALMSFTYNVGIGITAGFVLYPFCKLVSGRVGEMKAGLWVLAGLSLLFLCFIVIRRRITQSSGFRFWTALVGVKTPKLCRKP
jgi:adenine/guanine/hypoxanthine permease